MKWQVFLTVLFLFVRCSLGVMVIGTYLVYQLFWATAPDIEAPVDSSGKKDVETPAAGEPAAEAEKEETTPAAEAE